MSLILIWESNLDNQTFFLVCVESNVSLVSLILKKFVLVMKLVVYDLTALQTACDTFIFMFNTLYKLWEHLCNTNKESDSYTFLKLMLLSGFWGVLNGC